MNFKPGTGTSSDSKFLVPGTALNLYRVPKFETGPGPGSIGFDFVPAGS